MPTYGAAAYEDATGAVATPVVDGITAAASVPPASSAVAKEHYVAPGDSLWKISKQYGVSIDAIKAANQMTSDTVILGKKMIIPAP
jgi:LysM repeat protein